MREADLITKIVRLLTVLIPALVLQLTAMSSPLYGQQCRVYSSFVDRSISGKESSSVFVDAVFDLKFDEDGEFTKTVAKREPELRWFVAGRLTKGPVKGEPDRLSLKLAFEGDDEDTFESLDGVEAQTTFDKDWKSLAVRRNVEVGPRIYSVMFECSRRAGWSKK